MVGGNSETGNGRMKALPNNVPESALIEQIKIRPLLYDKNRREYRKNEESEAAWNEVATFLGVSVVNCKKRWKSLRDTFIKYYRLEILYQTQGSKKRSKPWNYYDELSFLKSHVEIFRLENRVQKEETSQAVNDEDLRKIILYEDDENQKEIYEILVSDEGGVEDYVVFKEGDNLMGPSYVESLEDSLNLDVVEEKHKQEIEQRPSNSNNNTEDAPVIRNITDPDEKYLMSCLPAFKRFDHQQKAYVRMAIEKLFYEVEFENVSDPRNKRLRTD